ncbi:MAG: flagellin lysine-N-methylase [Ruminococcus sp.]|uniref:flagellin lysine-N-methylase n=1 Tax=Ruminococcus sp. TaxID=41978 RepID=UPI002600184E|nr:flagellin lysine-N-methylase [Ruminococcus sp.]MBR5683921.1 flagellin lysine-N-methylase [Ruminococcus sp.]
MIYRTPVYCRDFRCIAGECRDSCCKGWEIDIDEAAAAKYAAVKGAFGERLRNSIKDGSFVLTEDERCPFLNKEGLCDIYTELGEENLCHICAEHPRYFEWFGTVKEGGTGLCCEASARLILSRPFELCEEEVPFEEAAGEYDEELFDMLLEARTAMLEAVCSDDTPFAEALCYVLDTAVKARECIDMPTARNEAEVDCDRALQAIFRCFSELEPIDEKWLPYIRSCAEKLKGAVPADAEHIPYLRRIAAYFLFRYVMKSVYDGNILGYASFAVVSTLFIGELFRCDTAGNGARSFEDCAETAKNYSKETEYCEENMEKLLELFETEDYFSVNTLKAVIRAVFGENVDDI